MSISRGTIGKNSRRILFLAAMLHAASAAANCANRMDGNTEATPDSAFSSDTVNGRVTHTPSGLIWKMCVEGMTFSAGTCTGTPALYSWRDALQLSTASFASQLDWRVPNRNELLSLVETACSSNTINTTIFPNSPPSGTVWTSTPLGVGDPVSAWAVRFGDGRPEAKNKTSLNYVRLVRAGSATNQDFNKATTNLPTGGPDTFSFNANTTALPGTQATSNVITLSGITGSVPISISGGEYLIIRPVTFTNTTETVNRAAHGFVFGNAVTFGSTGTLPVGITADTTYYATGKNSSGVVIGFNLTTESINWTTHGLSYGTRVAFTGGTLPTGITSGTTYYVTGKNSSGTAISFNPTGSVVTWASHGLLTCDGIVFTTGTPPTSIALNTTYYIRSVPTTSTFTLTSTAPTGLDCSGSAQRTFTGTGTGTQIAWTNKVLPDSFSIASTAQIQGIALGGTPAGATTVWTDVVLAGSFSISSTANGIQALTFADDGSGTHYLVQVGYGSWTSATGSVSNGDQLQVRLAASGTGGVTNTAAVNINGRTKGFSATTISPSPITFTSQTNVPTSSVATSDAPTLSGINGSVNITALSGTGGSLAVVKNGTLYTGSLPLAVSNGDTIALRQTTSGSITTATTAIVTINGQNFTFTATTGTGGATEPAAFSFNPQSDVPRAATITSDTVQVTGLTAERAVTVSGTGAAYKIGKPVSFNNASDLIAWTAHQLTVGTALTFTNVAGALPPELVRGTTYYVIGANRTIDAFQVSTTLNGPAVNFTTNGSGSNFAEIVGVPVTFTNNGTTLDLVNWSAHGLPADAILQFRNLGGALPTGITSGTSYYVIMANNTANYFQISTTRAGATSLDITSTGSGTHYAVRVGTAFPNTGVNITTDIFTTAAHGLSAGAMVKFRQTGGTLPTGITLGTPYYVIANNLTGTTFQVSATLNGTAVNMTVAPTGIQYVERLLNLMNNDSLTVSGTSSSSNNTGSTVTATINSLNFNFDFTTRLEPVYFYFDETTNALANQTTCTTNANCASGTANLGGISSGTTNTISVSYSTSGAVSINSGPWVASPTSFTSDGDDSIAVRLQTPNCNYSTVWADVTINGMTSRFMASTGESSPPPTGMVDFTPVANQAKNSAIEAQTPQTVAGTAASTCIRIENGQYKIGAAGTWTTGTAAAGTVAVGNAVYVRQTSSASAGATTRATLYINGTPFNFDVTTASGPAPFVLTPATAVTGNTIEESLPVTLTMSDLTSPVTFTNGTDRVNLAGHGLTVGNALRFATPGTMPGGLTAGSTYYVVNPTADNFQLSTTYPTVTLALFTTDGVGIITPTLLRQATIAIYNALGAAPGIEVSTNGGTSWSGTWATSKLLANGDTIKVRLTTEDPLTSRTSFGELLVSGYTTFFSPVVP